MEILGSIDFHCHTKYYDASTLDKKQCHSHYSKTECINAIILTSNPQQNVLSQLDFIGPTPSKARVWLGSVFILLFSHLLSGSVKFNVLGL